MLHELGGGAKLFAALDQIQHSVSFLLFHRLEFGLDEVDQLWLGSGCVDSNDGSGGGRRRREKIRSTH